MIKTTMTPEEAREQLARLGMTMGQFAVILERDEKTIRRWIGTSATHPIPVEISLTLQLLSKKQAGELREASSA